MTPRPRATLERLARPCRWASLQARSPGVPLRPDPRLRALLAHRYQRTAEPASTRRELVIPAGVVTPLVVDLDVTGQHPGGLICGPSGSHTVVDGVRPDAFIEACLAPLGAYRMFGSVVADVGESIVHLEDLVGPAARRLAARLHDATTWTEQARVLDVFLLDRRARGPAPSPEVSEAWDLLWRSGGTDAIGDIARRVGWSHKHLITKFREQVGVTPRMAARLLRLSRVWRLIDSGQSWARIAADSGYADQSHLVREFRQFTGTTPAALTAA